MIFHREVFDNGHRVHFSSDGTGAVQVECVTCKKLIMYAKTNPPTREELKAALLTHSELAPPVGKPSGEYPCTCTTTTAPCEGCLKNMQDEPDRYEEKELKDGCE